MVATITSRLYRLKKYEIIISLIFFTSISLVLFHPAINNILYWGVNIPGNAVSDQDQYYLIFGITRETLIKYHQLPLWNPYFCGGIPNLAYPVSLSFLSPFIIPVLLFGEVVGSKFILLSSTIFGMYGMFLLSRHLKFGFFTSYLPPIIFLFNTKFTFWFILLGHSPEAASLCILPWIFLYYLKGLNSKKELLLGGVFFSMSIFTSASNLLPFTVIFLTIYALCESVKTKSLGPLTTLVLLLIITSSISAIRLLPSYEYMQVYPRSKHTYHYGGYTAVETLYNALTSNSGLSWNYTAYIGFIPLFLTLLTLHSEYKKVWPLVVTCLFFILYSIAGEGYSGFYKLLHSLPILDMVRDPHVLIVFSIFSIAVLSGTALSRLEKKNKSFVYTLIIIVVVSWVLIDLLSASLPIVSATYVVTPIANEQITENRDSSLSMEISDRYIPGTIATSDYIPYLFNRGRLNCYFPMPVPRAAIPKYDRDTLNPQYRGEAFLLNGGGNATIIAYSPNIVNVKVSANKNDTLVLNQNFYPGWHTTSIFDDTVHPSNNLISVNVTSEDKYVNLYYLPLSFVVGSIISILSIVLGFIYVKFYSS